jgi:hypothetical protein
MNMYIGLDVQVGWVTREELRPSMILTRYVILLGPRFDSRPKADFLNRLSSFSKRQAFSYPVFSLRFRHEKTSAFS